MTPAVRNGILVGILLAFVQATISVYFLWWSWKKASFYKVWAMGTMARFLVFAVTAFVVYRFTSLNLAATLLSLAVATMLFMIFEIFKFLVPKK